MGLLQQDKAIFYHPLDNQGEFIESKTWTKASGNFTPAKVDSGLSREDTGAELSGLSADYAAATGATKVAFCGWFRKPSSAPAQSAAPAVDSPIGDGATSVSGTGVTGATVTVYVNGGGVGTALVTGGTWTKSVSALSAGDAVKAIQRSPGELESGFSGTVTVQAYSAAPAVTSPIGNGATTVSGTGVNGSTVEVFVGGGSVGNADAVVSGGAWTKTGMSPLSTGDSITAKQTESGKLQGPASGAVTVQAYSAAPTVGSPIGNGATSVSGTGVEGSTVEVFVDGGSVGNADGVVAGGAWTKTGMSPLSTDDSITAKQTESGKLQGPASGAVTVQAYSTAPVVTSPIYDGATSVSGTSAEADSTVIQVYKNGNPHGSTTTVGSGAWTQSGMTLATGDLVKAKATAPGELQSVFSTEVTVQAVSAIPTITYPIWNGATSVSGTGVNGSTVEVFVGGSSVGNADAVVSGGTWAKTGLSALSTGNSVTAKQTESGKPQSPASGAVTVQAPGFGAEAEFRLGNASRNSVAALSTTAIVVAYRDESDGDHGTAKVGTVSGTTVTFGAETEFLSSSTTSLSVAALSSTTFVVAYRDGSDSNHGTAKVGTVSGTGITFGAETEFLSTGDADYISVAPLSQTAFVVVYRDRADSDHGTAKVGTVSGTGITFGTEAEFHSTSNAIFHSVAALSSTTFVVAYRNNSNGYGTAKVGTISGTGITFGTAAEFTSGSTWSISAAALSSTAIVVTYEDYADSGHSTAKVGTVSGTGIVFGAESEFQSTNVTVDYSERGNFVTALSSTTFAVAYRDNADSRHGTAKIGTVSGTGIAFGTEAEFLSADGSNDISAAKIDSGKFVVVHGDGSDSNHGTAKVWYGPA